MRKVLFYAIIGIVGILLLSVQSAYMQLSHISGYATTLIHLKAWLNQGISTLHFSPSYTQGNIGDRFIQFYQGPIDSKGNCFYTSFPPGALWISYLWVKLWPIEMSLALGVFNTLLFIISLIGLGKWAFALLEIENYPKRSWIIPSSILLIGLTPLVLFFFANYYFIENISFTLSIWCSFLLWRYQQNEQHSKAHYFILIAAIFLLSFCESIGIFYGVVFIYILYKRQESIKPALFTLLASILLTIALYASIDVPWTFVYQSILRLVGRSGLTNAHFAENGATLWNGRLLQSGFSILKSEASPILFLSCSSLLLWIIAKRRQEEVAHLRGIRLAVLPVIIHTILFLNANLQHHQLIIKLLIIAWPILLIGFSNKRWIWSLLFIGAAYLSYVQLGYRFNYRQLEEERYVEQCANELKNTPRAESIFIKCSHAQEAQIPVLIYYSGRNIGLTHSRGKQAQIKSYEVDSFWHLSAPNLLHQ